MLTHNAFPKSLQDAKLAKVPSYDLRMSCTIAVAADLTWSIISLDNSICEL